VVKITSATMKVFYDYGGSDTLPGTSSNITDNGINKLRFKQADNNDIDLNNPIPVPSTGTEYSYWKTIYLKCTAINEASQINNVQFYSDGAVFTDYTGITLKVGEQFPIRRSDVTIGYDVADAAESMIPSYCSSSVDVSTLTSSSSLSLTIQETGNIIDATDETTNCLILQLEVGSTASSGTLTAETLTLSYDEA